MLSHTFNSSEIFKASIKTSPPTSATLFIPFDFNKLISFFFPVSPAIVSGFSGSVVSFLVVPTVETNVAGFSTIRFLIKLAISSGVTLLLLNPYTSKNFLLITGSRLIYSNCSAGVNNFVVVSAFEPSDVNFN